jgi:E3 ubiquitin-protein ligase synoviolin
MEDPQVPNDEEEERRRREEAMEQMLLAQEEAEDEEEEHHDHVHQDDDQALMQQFDQQEQPHHNFLPDPSAATPKPTRISYIQASFAAALGLIFYALRTRQQWYLALVYLSSSKWGYVVLGNALIAFCISTFQFFTGIFLNGLRLSEAEGLGDFFRWNITETCLALTMFRSELNVKTGVLFLVLVLAKCLHWVADMRESHLRMTDEAIIVHPTTGWPAIQFSHLKLVSFLFVLQFLDVMAVVHCGQDILMNGPSVSILFAFEGAILLVSVVSNILLWFLHVTDGLLHYVHENTDHARGMHRWIHPWKDYKATLIFAVEVQAQAAKFLFYVTFFAIVLTYYGMPINLFREVYLSFQQLKQRLVAFSKYRGLMVSMNRFASPNDEELDEAGRTCIICRDEMSVETSKKLPGCGHLFHKSCLREWLVQQQSCPTCRGDITAMEVRQRQQDDASQAAQERAALEQQDQDTDGQEETATGTQDQENQGTEHKAPQDSSGKADITSDDGAGDRKLKPHVSFEENPSIYRMKRHVRIAEPPVQDEVPIFPAFYRVVKDEGASVWNNGEAVSFEIRVVPFGVIILAKELSLRMCDGENRLMLLMPDGWVVEEDVERVHAVQLAKN